MSTPNVWEQAREALRECADDLEAEVNARYGNPPHHAEEGRRNRDMEPVLTARAVLAEMERWPVKEGCAAPSGDPTRGRWTVFVGCVPKYEDERPAILLVQKETDNG